MRQAPSNVALRVLSTVRTLSELSAIDPAPLQDGASVFVVNERAYYALVKGASNAPNGSIVVAAAKGLARWFRGGVGFESSLRNITQALWYVGGPDGDDSQDGATPQTALATWEQLAVRLDNGVFRQPSRIISLASAPGQSFLARIYYDGPEPAPLAPAITFEASVPQTVLDTVTLTDVTVEDHTTGQRYLLEAIGFDWTPHLDRRLRVVSGNNPDAVAWAQAVGPSVAEVYVNPPINPVTFNTAPFAIGDTLQIESLFELGSVALDCQPTVKDLGIPLVHWRDLRLAAAHQRLDQSMMQGCEIVADNIEARGFTRGQLKNLTGFGNYVEGNIFCDAVWAYCSTRINRVEASLLSLGRISQIGALSIGLNGGRAFLYLDNDCSFWDWTDAAIDFHPGCGADLTERAWGSSAVANSFGIRVRVNASIAYRAGARLPTVAGAAAHDINIGGATALYAALPAAGANPNNNNAWMVVRG